MTRSNTPEDDDIVHGMTPAQKAALEFARHARRRIPLETKDEKRQALPSRHTWDGNMDNFREFQKQVEGFHCQVVAGYLFLKEFQKRYKKDGSACWIYFMDDVASESQVNRDIKALYGALLSACKVGVGSSILAKHSETRNGLSAWMDMVAKYKNGGDKETQIDKLEEKLDIKFTDHYSGGLVQWVTDYENTFLELEQIGCTHWMDDDARKRRILKNVNSDSTMDKFLLKHQVKDMNSSQVLYLFQTFLSFSNIFHPSGSYVWKQSFNKSTVWTVLWSRN